MKRLAFGGALFLIALGGWATWHYAGSLGAMLSRAVHFFWGPTLPPGFASGNGRIEATQYDIATKRAGRIAAVLVREGEMVEKGQILARMDTQDLEADFRGAEAQLGQAREDLRRAIATVTQRESDIRRANAAIAQRQSDLLRADAAIAQRASEVRRADATIAQRESELVLARQDVERAQPLLGPGAVTRQEFDQYATRMETAEAMLTQARAAREAAEGAWVEARAQRQVAEAAVAQEEAQKQSADAALMTARIDIDFRQKAIDAAVARVQRVQADLNDSALGTPIPGRVLYRLAEPGEVLAAGGKVVTVLDLSDVYMTVFLPTEKAGRLMVGAEGRIVLDAVPDLVIPATVSFVAPRSQFTPKEVETRTEREKLTFRVKVQIAPDLLLRHLEKVRTGLPGVGYVRLDPSVAWPEYLHVKLPR